VIKALQIFHVLRAVGRYHDISAGLVIGGASLAEERELIDQVRQILVVIVMVGWCHVK